MAFLSPIPITAPTPQPLRPSARTRPPSRPHRPPLRIPHATLQNPDKDAPAPPADTVSKLRSDHLAAYFAADESMYQTRLSSVSNLGARNFAVELGELVGSLRRAVGLEPPLRYTPPDCLNLSLSDEAVANREREREFERGEIPASAFVRLIYDVTCQFLDLRFRDRPIPRFWFLETVARMPYFAYSSCLHLFSTLGWFRSPTLMNMHHAEELNEAYHLAVMESLGGDKRWADRFLAFHASIVYYWFCVISFLISPIESYRFSHLIESHAVDTYAEFLEANEQALRNLPAPDVAYEYYENFIYYFYEFQMTSPSADIRARPRIESLYDVFQNILEDELEHTRTMKACTDYIKSGDVIWYNGKCVSGRARGQVTIPPEKRQKFWKDWTKLYDDEGTK